MGSFVGRQDEPPGAGLLHSLLAQGGSELAVEFDTLPETRWFASLMVVGEPDADAPDTNIPPPKRRVVEPAG